MFLARFLIAGLALLGGVCHADSITDYKISISTNDPPGYLVIVTTVVWNGDRPEAWKKVWSPASYQDYSLQNGAFYPEKGGWSYHFEAYARPNKNGYLFLKVNEAYESRSIDSVALVDRDDAHHPVALPAMSPLHFYWSNDGKFLYIDSSTETEEGSTFKYDAVTGKQLEQVDRAALDMKSLRHFADY